MICAAWTALRVENPPGLTRGLGPTSLLTVVCWGARERLAAVFASESLGVQTQRIGRRMDRDAVRTDCPCPLVGPGSVRDALDVLETRPYPKLQKTTSEIAPFG